jgi:phosphodiesterase/alkaline phosphatase D-like protein
MNKMLLKILLFLCLITRMSAAGDSGEIYTILGRPTENEITLRIISTEEYEVKVEYGKSGSTISTETSEFPASRDFPATILLEDLEKSTDYTYRLLFKRENDKNWTEGELYNFTTARDRGESFSFLIQADSHLANKADEKIYQQVMDRMNEKNHDLFFDLGDTFINDTDINISFDEVNQNTFDQVPYLSQVAQSTPLFLVLGNHEGEYGFLNDGTKDNLPVYSTLSRKQYFPNPEANDFYSANEEIEPFVGTPQNYYSFTWGDALFVTIDPYRYTISKPENSKNPWDWTLGEKQYFWLKEILEKSDAKYKFVFSHHLNGNSRGSTQIASLLEWGGYNNKGVYEFDARRPGWDKPVHQLMADNNVTVFFQGHDHIFAQDELDDVIYQTLPKPAEVIPDRQSNEQYYEGADILTNSGFLQVNVSEECVQIDYIRSYVAGQTDADSTGIVYSYTVNDKGELNVLTHHDDSEFIAEYHDNDERVRESSNRGQRREKKPKGEKAVKEEPSSEDGLLSAEIESMNHVPHLSSPTDSGINISAYFDNEETFYISYGLSSDSLNQKSHTIRAAAGESTSIKLSGLAPGQRYYYRLSVSSELYSFKTQKSPGESYSFIIEADPHFDDGSGDSVYRNALENMKELDPDFLVDLGDVTMAEKLTESNEEILYRSNLVRSYWDDISGSVPYYMVLGNHDGEAGWNFTNRKPIGEYTSTIRRNLFPNPTPETDDFYNGLSDFIYSWTWGDALFVTLNPYGYMENKPKDDNWLWTLGEEQYRWLEETLENSEALYKFVFIHNLVGGINKENRGGSEAAKLYEWGGLDINGSDMFEEKRPDWPSTIHELFVKNKVSAVFHGHDHFYAKEELDGIIYQLVPQPSLEREQNVENITPEYGYFEGLYLPSPGFLQVTINKNQAVVNLRNSLNNDIIYSYVIDSSKE